MLKKKWHCASSLLKGLWAERLFTRSIMKFKLQISSFLKLILLWIWHSYNTQQERSTFFSPLTPRSPWLRGYKHRIRPLHFKLYCPFERRQRLSFLLSFSLRGLSVAEDHQGLQTVKTTRSTDLTSHWIRWSHIELFGCCVSVSFHCDDSGLYHKSRLYLDLRQLLSKKHILL